MKTNRISFKWLIPLFLFFGVLLCCSLTAYAAPTAPTSVTVTIQKDGTTVTQAAKGSKVTISAQASGGSGTSAYYEYSFSYKVGGTQWAVIKNFSQAATAALTLSETGTYTIRVNARVKDSSGASQSVTRDINVTSVGVSNTSTISSSAVNVGENVTINASATGGTHYEYYYSVSTDGGSHYAPIQPSSSSAQYVASASCSYKPSSAANYLLRVFVRDKETGSTDQKVFSVTASNATVVNLCDVSQTEVEITKKDQKISLIFNADKGKAPYKYRCSYTIDGTGNQPVYVVGDASNFESVGANKPFTIKQTGNHVFTFEVQDSSGSTNTFTTKKRVIVSTNLVNTTSISSNRVSNRGEIGMNFSATGGTGDYEYKFTYRINGKEVVCRDYNPDNSPDNVQISGIIEAEKLDKNFTGEIVFKSYVRDRNLQIVVGKEYKVTVTEALATEITRQELNNLYVQVSQWENTLTNSQRDYLYNKEPKYMDAKTAAYNAILNSVVQDYEKHYFDLMDEWTTVKNKALGGDEFWMTTEINNAVAFENSVIKSVEGWFTSFSGTNVSVNTFSFNVEDFVNEFSQIFVIFASALLVILFGVNIIKTALEYQLFTLKGAISVFGRLILAEIWIQLSTKICIMVVKIFNELMASIIASINASGLLKITTQFNFEPVRSGVWLIDQIVDFFLNLGPFLLIMLLVGVVLVVFLIVYVKLIIRTLEIAMLAVISPTFFACSVGEATMPYFRKFITAFLSVCAEIIFMGVVYLAFLWYCKGVNLTAVNVNELYNFNSTTAGTFYTYTAVTIACGIMMIRPPQVLRDLVR